MLNYRKIRQDFNPNLLKKGKELFEKQHVLHAEISELTRDSLRVSAQVIGNFDHRYECEIEIDRGESQLIDSNCDCPYHSDCQHLAAMIFHLEEHLEHLIVAYSEEVNLQEATDEEDHHELLATVAEAKVKQDARVDEVAQKELIEEYVAAAKVLSESPFFAPHTTAIEEAAELLVSAHSLTSKGVDLQLALRLSSRTKPIHLVQVSGFLEAVRYEEPIFLAGRRHLLSLTSFQEVGQAILKHLMAFGKIPEATQDRQQRVIQLDTEAFGDLLSLLSDHVSTTDIARRGDEDSNAPPIPFLYWEGFEQPFRYSRAPALFRFRIETLQSGPPRLFLQSSLWMEGEEVAPEKAVMLEGVRPGLVFQGTYYRFAPAIRRSHLRSLKEMQDLPVPEPLFGSLIENGLPALRKIAQVMPCATLARCLTIPSTASLEATCALSYIDGELEAQVHFLYEGEAIPSELCLLKVDQLRHFCTPQGILARPLTEERALLDDLFQDFHYQADQGVYVAKSDRRIVEFMTEIVPQYQGRVHFECPKALLDRFVYDRSEFFLEVRPSASVDRFEIALHVEGDLRGISVEALWDCVASKRSYLEIPGSSTRQRTPRILVLDLEKLSSLVQLFDEIGIRVLDNHVEERPLWTLVSLQPQQLSELPLKVTIAPELLEMQQQMLQQEPVDDPIPLDKVRASLRRYQVEGVQWLNRLRKMHLNGILADDMGLGKTLQAIATLCHVKEHQPDASALIICPTSLLYNWKEELSKFAPQLSSIVVDGVPTVRKKLLQKTQQFDVVITSYTLLQKDIEVHRKRQYTYAILDEAQHIKNRGTRNAKSVKMIHANHRLILSGTPVENSLEELWSLFDFLMPGLLGTFERFQEKYMRLTAPATSSSSKSLSGRHLEPLRRKIAPFILRRMKSDVLQDLPPISESIYHCQLSSIQQELYRSYAASAREELTRLVKKEGFEKVQIHVLATLTRLKQICCHPGIFAKEQRDEGDSAKYELLLDLLQNLMDNGHKTVIFSQYTRMLQIMREDFLSRGIRFCYLDGSSKNRLEIVQQFNEDPTVPVFLVSLKAGGTGLNLCGADTVIHYDIWWNPAVENQATDRVHRLGQDKPVTSYKLVTLQTIEEKILQMQQRKRGLVKKVVGCDDEALAKLTWEEVLELLQT